MRVLQQVISYINRVLEDHPAVKAKNGGSFSTVMRDPRHDSICLCMIRCIEKIRETAVVVQGDSHRVASHNVDYEKQMFLVLDTVVRMKILDALDRSLGPRMFQLQGKAEELLAVVFDVDSGRGRRHGRGGKNSDAKKGADDAKKNKNELFWTQVRFFMKNSLGVAVDDLPMRRAVSVITDHLAKMYIEECVKKEELELFFKDMTGATMQPVQSSYEKVCGMMYILVTHAALF